MNMEVIQVLINEVCKECKLTKKSIEYYEEQGLITPAVQENGYRNFSQSDVAQLKKIAVLRGLGLSVSDIQRVLASQGGEALHNVSDKKDLEIADLQVKQKLIEKLARDNDWEHACAELETLEKKQSIIQRLLGKFPGYYGKYLSLHFAQYLNGPITTEEQQKAFETIIAFLDGVNIVIPEDLQEYFDEVTKNIDREIMLSVSEAFPAAVQNAEQYMSDNKEMLEQYIAFKKSDEYKQSSAYKLQELFKQFNSESGYNDIFIPAMQRLSKSYREHSEALQKANEVFLRTCKESDVFE